MCILLQILPLLFADPSMDAISGGAGWVGAGLLGLVLGWLLLVRIPTTDKLMEAKDARMTALIESRDKLIRDKDIQMTQVIESRDKLIKEIASNHDATFAIAEKDRRADFQAALGIVISNCQREFDMVKEVVSSEVSEMSSAIIDLRRSLEELREAYLRQSPGKES